MTVWLTWLADAARGAGLAVTEDPGWQTRGHGPMVACEGIVGHHTAGPAQGDHPSLAVVRNGRADLAGPLSHIVLGRSGEIITVAAGTCWHAGLSAHAGFTNLNDKYIGIEAESTGLGGNGDWTPAQLDIYPRICAALLKHMGHGSDRYASHRLVALPAGRKIDPTGISDIWMRERIDAILRQGPPVPAGTPWLALPTLSLNDKGAGVMALQKWLVKMFPSYAKFTPTGFYGPDTKATIAEFQKRVKITGADADGSTVGPRTKKAFWDAGFRG